MKAIIGKKVGMSQIFDENGHVIPVTVIEAGPCVVVQKKTSEKEGYEAVQLGFEDISERKLTKPEKGHLDKAGVAPKKYLREFDLENAAELNVGDIVKADAFQAGDFVDVTGISKGHGYQGVIKRHGAHRLKETHGSGPVARQIGSLGATSHMSKIIKGTIGAGQMGNEQVTVMNLDVVKVDPGRRPARRSAGYRLFPGAGCGHCRNSAGRCPAGWRDSGGSCWGAPSRGGHNCLRG